MSDDPLVERTESTAASEGGANVAQAANLFDLRRIIGGVFGVWGVLLDHPGHHRQRCGDRQGR